MRHRLLVAALVALALVPAARAAEPEPVATSADVVDGIAAQVGTDVVLISEVQRLSAPIAEEMRKAGASDSDVAMMRSEVLEKLIDRHLVLLFAKRNEVEASEPEIDEAVAAIARENQFSPEQLKKNVEAQGMSWEAYRARMGEEILQQKVVGGAVRSRVRVEDQEVKDLYEERYGSQPTTGTELHLQHIAVGAVDDKPASKKAACDKVRAALSRVRAGTPFMEVAGQVSEGSPELGWVHESSLAPWMIGAVDSMQPGQISNVIELPIGCAVLKLLERREAQPQSYEQAQGPLRAALFEQRFQQEYERFLERLRKQTYVDRKGAFADASRLAAPGAEAPRLQ